MAGNDNSDSILEVSRAYFKRYGIDFDNLVARDPEERKRAKEKCQRCQSKLGSDRFV